MSEFAEKAEAFLEHGIHLLLVDLIPPGPHDPLGMHGVIGERFGDEPQPLPDGEPLTLASYAAGDGIEVYLEYLAVGDLLKEMPLFFHPDRYVRVPLEATYMAAYQAIPRVWQDVLEGGKAPS